MLGTLILWGGTSLFIYVILSKFGIIKWIRSKI